MFRCSKCGRSFGVNEIGHIDDHFEICKDCEPRFRMTGKGKDVVKALNNICYFGKKGG
jgi:DNA-directed RNA polymerase subunit RPC12/RpoP